MTPYASGFRFGSPLKSRAAAAGADELFLDEGERPPPRTAAAAGRRMGGWADERAKTAKSVSMNFSSFLLLLQIMGTRISLSHTFLMIYKADLLRNVLLNLQTYH